MELHEVIAETHQLENLEDLAIIYLKRVGRLPPDFKEKWLYALRVGELKQGTGSLCTRHHDGVFTYCCIGVAGFVTGILERYMIDRMYFIDQVPPGFMKLLPEQLTGVTPLVVFLSKANDDETWSFLKIADWVEEYC